MSRKELAIFTALPILTFVAYVAARALLAEGWQKFIYAENGPIELGTAACFGLAGSLALLLARTARRYMPEIFRALFVVFALGCSFVALEEVSYGQQLFRWRSPTWFEQNNHHGQTNLHNLMGNRPSHILKNVANYGTLVGFIIVPAIAMFRGAAYRPGHWTYFLLPRAELIVPTSIAQLCSVLWDLPKSTLGTYWHQGWNELRELFWGMAALGYVAIIGQRLLSSRRAQLPIGETVAARNSSELSKSAA